jgi:hypothetical protein
MVLIDHLGEKVELTGTIPGRVDAASDGKAAYPLFRVESGKTLETSCSE